MVCDTFILEHVVTYPVALDMFLDKQFFDLCSLQVNMDADRAQPSSTSATSWSNTAGDRSLVPPCLYVPIIIYIFVVNW